LSPFPIPTRPGEGGGKAYGRGGSGGHGCHAYKKISSFEEIKIPGCQIAKLNVRSVPRFNKLANQSQAEKWLA
jgi:hypothetical protein